MVKYFSISDICGLAKGSDSLTGGLSGGTAYMPYYPAYLLFNAWNPLVNETNL